MLILSSKVLTTITTHTSQSSIYADSCDPTKLTMSINIQKEILQIWLSKLDMDSFMKTLRSVKILRANISTNAGMSTNVPQFKKDLKHRDGIKRNRRRITSQCETVSQPPRSFFTLRSFSLTKQEHCFWPCNASETNHNSWDRRRIYTFWLTFQTRRQIVHVPR